ncbi:hypothetical protein LIER_29308 [Lithospermum erythrorhizon]|uniref:Helicase-like transcription factor CHR28 n=1 Tax=Lithospermum erythrorhizon TaxID=34254 RepID=A0AAV3RKD0_LITER
MLMADEQSDLLSLGELPIIGDDDELGIDLDEFWDLMGDTPDSIENNLVDPQLINMPQVAASFLNIESGVSSKAGVSASSSHSAGTSMMFDCVKLDPSSDLGSPVNSLSGSFHDWMPCNGQSHIYADSNKVYQNAGMSFEYLSPKALIAEDNSQDSILRYKEDHSLIELDGSTFGTSHALATSSEIQGTSLEIDNQSTDIYLMSREASLGQSSHSYLESFNISDKATKMEEYRRYMTSPTGSREASDLNVFCLGDRKISSGLPCAPSNMFHVNQNLPVEETINDKLFMFEDIGTQFYENNNADAVYNSNGRAYQHLDTFGQAGFEETTAHDYSVGVQASEQFVFSANAALKQKAVCTKVRQECIPNLPKDSSFCSNNSQVIESSSFGKSYSVDNDVDVCILEDMSDPARRNLCVANKKPLIVSPSSFSRPVSSISVGHVRHKTDAERFVFRAALQDLSQPKSEDNPPDGQLAVPLLRHQRIALSWMVKKEMGGDTCSGGILADDQGLGKTISTISLILKERSPSFGACSNHIKPKEAETVNLDEDDDDGSSDSSQPNSCILNDGCISLQNKGRLAAGTLIVCPTSVLRQWSDELHSKVTSQANLSVLVYHGSSRTKDASELAKYDVVLTTYSIVSMEMPKQPLADDTDNESRKRTFGNSMESSSIKKRKNSSSSSKNPLKGKKGIDPELLESIASPIARVGWFRVVLDEAQSIKNHRTQVARACWGLRAKRRWCLSGTPIQNSVDDLYSYFRFLRVEAYIKYKSFCSKIKVPIQRNPANGYRKLQAVLKTIMLRRTKGTFLDGEPIIDIPPKTIELRKVDFTEEERDFYSQLEADSRAQFAEYAAAGTVKQNYVNILLMLLRLRQACDHPLLVKGYHSKSVERSSLEMAKKLPREKQTLLLNCLQASQAICGVCSDPPEDAVVTVCGHVFCTQCIFEHLTGDDKQCPSSNCKILLNAPSIFTMETLRSSLCGQPSLESATNGSKSGSGVGETPDPFASGYNSSKISAALHVLQSLPRPQSCDSGSTSVVKDETMSPDSCLEGFDAVKNEKKSSDLPVRSSALMKVGGEKAIVFSQWTRMLDLLEDCLKKSSIQYRRLDGTMSVLARDKAVKDFNTLPEVSVMIMSLKAASLGLNMVAACHVLLLDLWWNPTTEDQAIDRAHRIGQTRPVTVVRLTVKDTVEDRILALQQKKREMVASAFGEDESGTQQSRLTVEDLQYLFGHGN